MPENHTKTTFAGADYSAAQKQPNPTWLAVGSMADGYLQISRLKNIGSDRLFKALCDLKDESEQVACGLDFPFGWPLSFLQFLATEKGLAINACTAYLAEQPFAEVDLLARNFALARAGLPEPRRYSDGLMRPKAQSPLHRINPGMLKMTWQGTGLLLQLRAAGFAVCPADDKELVWDLNLDLNADLASRSVASIREVYPAATLAAFDLPFQKYKGQDASAREIRAKIIQDLGNAPRLRTVNNLPGMSAKDFRGLRFGAGLADLALKSDDALDAALACLGALLCFLAPELIWPGAVVSEPLTTDLKTKILLEGWIYSPYLALPGR